MKKCSTTMNDLFNFKFPTKEQRFKSIIEKVKIFEPAKINTTILKFTTDAFIF